jgi:hypothetical protein
MSRQQKSGLTGYFIHRTDSITLPDKFQLIICERRFIVNAMSITPPYHLPTLLSYLTPNRLTQALDLYTTLSRWHKRQRQTGMYEILDYDSVLDLVDANGETAIFKRRQRVRFLQDHIIAFQDYAWGEGEIFAGYSCSPGRVVDRYREGDQWNILISLRETKSAGDVIDFYTERTIKDGFTTADEWWQVEIRHQTRQFRLAIIFPGGATLPAGAPHPAQQTKNHGARTRPLHRPARWPAGANLGDHQPETLRELHHPLDVVKKWATGPRNPSPRLAH